ncbi:MAG: putative metal-binding motif-containing protein [Proteobacteria bacterium]|nr:putative metal-binding motif-containing protein [Pseudomonadota bacterium]
MTCLVLSGCLIRPDLRDSARAVANGGSNDCLSVEQEWVDLGTLTSDADRYATLVFQASCDVTVTGVVLEGQLGDGFRILGDYQDYEVSPGNPLPIDVNTSLSAPAGPNLTRVVLQTAGGSASAYVSSRVEAPKIRLSRGGHDFGPVDPNQSQTATVRIENESLVDTDVRVTTGSGVLTTWEGSYYVPAGQSSTVTIQIDVTDLSPVASYVDFAIDGNSQTQMPIYANDCGNGEVNKYDFDDDGLADCFGDCDDGDDQVGPHVREVADHEDQDCDTRVDEGTAGSDDDGDSYCEGFDYGAGTLQCHGTATPGDCTDGLDASFDGDVAHPSHPETPDNGIDDNCDGTIDEGGTSPSDPDGDGFTEAAGDCLDDPSVFPGANELADGKDNDCDNKVDEGFDGYDDDGDGTSELNGDCNDNDVTICPGCAENSRGVDDDCDGTIDEGSDFVDDDGDGDTERHGDCDDDNIDVHRGADEVVNGDDDDCDGRVDEGVLDVDGDGFSVTDGDCNDGNYWASPQMTVELCDGADNNCDGTVDEGCD